jgi:hypothetical protein
MKQEEISMYAVRVDPFTIWIVKTSRQRKYNCSNLFLMISAAFLWPMSGTDCTSIALSLCIKEDMMMGYLFSLKCNCKADCDMDMQYTNLLGQSGSIDSDGKNILFFPQSLGREQQCRAGL